MKQRIIVASLALAVVVAVGPAQVSNEALRKWATERNKAAAIAASASQPASVPAEPIDCNEIKAMLGAAQDKVMKAPASKAQIYEEASAAVKSVVSTRPVKASFRIAGISRDKGITTLFVQGPLPPDAEKRAVVLLGNPIAVELQEPAEQAGLIRRNINLVVRGKAALIPTDDKDHQAKGGDTFPVARENLDGTFTIKQVPAGGGTGWQALPGELGLFRVEDLHLVLLKDTCSYQVGEETFKPAPASQPSSQAVKP